MADAMHDAAKNRTAIPYRFMNSSPCAGGLRQMDVQTSIHLHRVARRMTLKPLQQAACQRAQALLQPDPGCGRAAAMEHSHQSHARPRGLCTVPVRCAFDADAPLAARHRGGQNP
jgi:hypothetical protein